MADGLIVRVKLMMEGMMELRASNNDQREYVVPTWWKTPGEFPPPLPPLPEFDLKSKTDDVLS